LPQDLNRRVPVDQFTALGVSKTGLDMGSDGLALLKHPVFEIELFADDLKDLIENLAGIPIKLRIGQPDRSRAAVQAVCSGHATPARSCARNTARHNRHYAIDSPALQTTTRRDLDDQDCPNSRAGAEQSWVDFGHPGQLCWARSTMRYLRFASVLLALPLLASNVRVYQTNSAGDEVHVIDAATNKVVQTIKDIEVPHGVTFAPDGTRAYITCESEKTVWAVDTKSGKVIAKVPLSGHPNNLSVSKDGKHLFVAIAVAPGSVDVIDTVALKNMKTVKIKGAVHNTYVTPDGKYAMAGSVAGKTLTAIDTLTLEPVWTMDFDLGVRPMAFEKAPDGSTSRVFVQLSGYNGFSVVDFKMHKEIKRIDLPKEPGGGHAEGGAPSHGIGIPADGKTLWVNSSIANAVFIYSLPDLNVLGYVKTGDVPDWITFTPDSKMIYIANSGANSVSAIDIAARKEVARIPVGEVPKRNGTVVLPN
jgi:YVTN family beta-propeller protein